MTTAPARRESLLRLVWSAFGDSFPGPAIFVGLILLMAGYAWYRRDQPLGALALEFRMPVFFLGTSLMQLSSVISRRYQPGQSFALLNLTPAIVKAGPSSRDPGNTVVAQPVLAGLASACLGFALGLSGIVALLHAATAREPRAVTALWCLAPALMLAGAPALAARSTRRLYAWSQEVAASAATAEAAADRARIAALQAQMNPHFLFNALNTVASLLGTDGARARATVQNLSGMLQHTLQRSARPLTTVEEELQFVRDYLEIERERFGARLQVTYDIDPAVAAMAVPTMSLQPLVENAIKHAVTSRLEGGHIRIAAGLRVDPPRLVLSVEDDGPGFPSGSEDGTGLGNLRARLRTLYDAGAELVTETLATGARVILTIQAPLNPKNPS